MKTHFLILVAVLAVFWVGCDDDATITDPVVALESTVDGSEREFAAEVRVNADQAHIEQSADITLTFDELPPGPVMPEHYPWFVIRALPVPLPEGVIRDSGDGGCVKDGIRALTPYPHDRPDPHTPCAPDYPTMLATPFNAGCGRHETYVGITEITFAGLVDVFGVLIGQWAVTGPIRIELYGGDGQLLHEEVIDGARVYRGFETDVPAIASVRIVPLPMQEGDITIVKAAYSIDNLSFRMEQRRQLDIRPGSDRNPFNLAAHGVLPVALVGDSDFDVNDVDPASLALEGVAPIRWSVEDVSGAASEIEDCGGNVNGPDGISDLVLHFPIEELANALGSRERGERVVLTLTGSLLDGTSFVARDCVVVVGGGNKRDHKNAR